MTEYRNDLIATIDCYGNNHQIDIAIEEMSELTKALLKFRRYVDTDTPILKRDYHRKNIIEEIADVLITIEELKIIFGCDAEVKRAIGYKMRRLSERLKSNFEEVEK